MRSSRPARPHRSRGLQLLAAIALLTAAIAAPPPAAAQQAGAAAKRVVAYWGDWEYWSDPSFTHDNVDFSRLTHVNYAFAWSDETGTIYFTDETVFDGLDLDFEYPGYAPHGGRPIDKANYTLLLQALRARFDAIAATTGKRYELTAAVSCGVQIANDAYDYPAVTALLDHVDLLAYDFGGDWDPVAQHMSPLFPYPGEVNAGFDADSCREFWMTTGTAPADEIVLGMAHYGRSFQGAKAIGDASGGHDAAHWGVDTETPYEQIAARMQSDPTFHTAYDAVARTHYGWFDGGGFISFEDTTSIAERARYVVEAYVSTFAPNWWSPAAAPAYWQETTCGSATAGG